MARSKLSQRMPSVQPEAAPLPALEIIKGRPATTSMQIAAHFGKRHDHVLRDIDNLLSQLPENSLQPNFGEILQEQKTPLGVKRTRVFSLDRDAFSLVVMGFTGKEALAWKLRYIEAFNAMEKMLRAPQPAVLAPFLQVKVLPRARREQLAELLLAKLTHVPAAHAWKARMSVWTAFNRNFSIPQYRLLPESRMDEAVAFLSALTIGPTGKVVHKNRQASLPTDDMRQVASALTHLIAQAKTLLPLLQTATPEVCA